MKKCNKTNCEHNGALQHLDNFYKNPTMADGRMRSCKDCEKKESLEKAKIKKGNYHAIFDLFM
jgi:hypothetical protein